MSPTEFGQIGLIMVAICLSCVHTNTNQHHPTPPQVRPRLGGCFFQELEGLTIHSLYSLIELQHHSPSKMNMNRQDGDWLRLQRVIFSRWVRQKLLRSGLEVTDVVKDAGYVPSRKMRTNLSHIFSDDLALILF